MKVKHYLRLFTVVFILLFFVLNKTVNIKYVLLNISIVCIGILFRINDIEHPSSPHDKRQYAKGHIAWFGFIVVGSYFFVYFIYKIYEKGLW